MLFLCSGRRASSVHWFLLSLDHSSPVSLFGISGPSRRSCFGEEDCSPSTVTQGPIFWAWVWETPRPPTAPLPLSSAASHCLPHGQHTPHTRPFPLQGLLPSLPYQLPTLLGSQHVQCWGGVWQDTGTAIYTVNHEEGDACRRPRSFLCLTVIMNRSPECTSH